MSNPRRHARHSRNTTQESGEENAIWHALQKGLAAQEREIQKSNDLDKRILTLQTTLKAKGGLPTLSHPDLQKLDEVFRESVKIQDNIKQLLDENKNSAIILKALREAGETKGSEASGGGGGRRVKERETPSLLDHNDRADSRLNSPAPSPLPDPKRKSQPLALSSYSRERGDVPLKKEDAETASVASSIAAVPDPPKKKITFKERDIVAFRPKPTPGTTEAPDWIQGVVVKVIGESKSRRYDVQDPEPDESGKIQVYRTSASSMVPIPDEGALEDYGKGKTVLARYPDTTTFYSAQVVGMNGGMVVLRFDGEDEKEKVTEVDRRFVLDHKI